MKNLGFLAVVALLMMFGCSKDDLITTEQEEPFSLEKNQPIINGARPGSATMSVSGISFFSSSIKNDINDIFIRQWTQKDEVRYPDLTLERKLLIQGNFSGKIAGYGNIIATSSKYVFSKCEPIPFDGSPDCGEPLMYNFVAEGEIYLSTRDHCSITITGNLYPWYYTDIKFDGGLVIGTAITHDGFGKLKLNKTFSIWRSGINRYDINLKTGEIGMVIRD